MCLDWHGPQGTCPRDSAVLREIRQEAADEGISHALDSHAAVEQAVGVLLAVHGISPTAGIEVLREVAQHTDIRVHSVAETLMAWALGRPLPEPVDQELNAAVERRARGDATNHRE
nr:ANTAR domain-containing protein [Streptomyces geranii]